MEGRSEQHPSSLNGEGEGSEGPDGTHEGEEGHPSHQGRGGFQGSAQWWVFKPTGYPGMGLLGVGAGPI
jgi:hypothetical protein